MSFRNGTYSGFAQKGGTDRERLRLQIEQAELDNPDSRLWQTYAQGAKLNLADAIGPEAFLAYADLVWPGSAVDDCTWRDICRQHEAALAIAKASQEWDVDLLAQAARMALQVGVSAHLEPCNQNTTESAVCHNLGAGND
jgi:hypothetical protein